MQCELLFYMAHKTGKNETILTNQIKATKLKITKTMVATSPLDLAEQLSSSLKRSNLIFLIGGLQKEDETNTVDLLSKTLESKSSHKINCKKIENQNGKTNGYIVQSGMQMIVMLPDIPDELNQMCGYVLLKYISEFYKLPFEMKPDIRENIVFTPIEDVQEFFSKVYKNTAYNYDDDSENRPSRSEIIRANRRAFNRMAIGAIIGTIILVAAVVYFFVEYVN